MSPISSMCPASITLGEPPPFRVAKELPILSPRTSSANFSASVRHTLAAAPSLPLGPGVESRFFKNSYDASLMRSLLRCRKAFEQRHASPNRLPEVHGCRISQRCYSLSALCRQNVQG